MSLLSSPRGAAPGSARLRRSGRPSPGAPSVWRGASHGAGGAHLAAGQVPASSGDAPAPAARTPPAPPPLPPPGAPGEAPPAGKGNACAEGGEGRHFEPPQRPPRGGSARLAQQRRRPGNGAVAEGARSEAFPEPREAGLWLTALVLRSSRNGGKWGCGSGR